MAECNNYGFNVPVDVCVDGPVSAGQTAGVEVRVLANDASSSQKLGKKSGFGAMSPKTYTGWADAGTYFGCTIVGSTLKVILGPGDDMVTVEVTLTVKDCPGGGGVYSSCGGSGPHTLTGTQTLKIKPGDCPF